MGFRVSWIARAGTSTAELLDVSGRHLTGERHEFPDVGFYLLEVSAGTGGVWVVLIADGSENFGELDATLAQSLSDNGHETLYFWCSDTVMATDLICFKNGDLAWSIQYDCESRTQQPTVNGAVPAITHELLKDLRLKQIDDSEVDYLYDLTAELGRRLVGFRHDTDLETDDPEPFQVLSG